MNPIASTPEIHSCPSEPKVSILMYHQVGRFRSPKNHRAQFCHVRRFRGQMRYLHYFGYNVLSLEQALKGLFHGEPLPPKPVVLTFDDGYRNFYENAVPILADYGFPAIVYAVSNLIGGRNQWVEATGREGADLMDLNSLRELGRHNIAIGSHSLTHPRLSQIPEDRMRREVLESKARLEDLLGQPVPDFCYPYGDYDERVRDAAIEAGYRSALTCIRGAANTADNAWEIPRKAISFGDLLPGFWWKIHKKNEKKLRPGKNAIAY